MFKNVRKDASHPIMQLILRRVVRPGREQFWLVLPEGRVRIHAF